MFNRSNFDAFIAGQLYKPNDFQFKVLESVAFGSGNIVVSALAGSGKTSLLVQTAHLFKAMGITSVGYLAFNKSIKEELNSRLPIGYAAVNSHSLGNQVLKQANPKTLLDNTKWNTIAKNMMSAIGVEPQSQYTAGKAFQALCSKVMLNMIDPEDLERIAEIKEQYSLDTVTGPMMMVVADAISQAEEIWERSGKISFDEMLYLPVVKDMEPPKHDFFLVDECQDLNILQQELAFRSVKPGGRSIFVGDKCQPEGTKVAVVKSEGNRFHHAQIEQVNIEDLQIGDRVVSYTPAECAFVQRGRLVTGITKRPYSGRLIVASTEQGHVSRYTPNHHCFASFEPLRGKHVIYMMRRGNQFRIGKAMMDYSGGRIKGGSSSGPIARARAEKADALWLLATYDTNMEAIAMEGAIAGRFGLPELIFQCIDGKVETQQVIDNAWAFIGNNISRAIDCLKHFGRDIDYPLYDRTKHAHYLSFKRPIVVHASNLMDGALMLPYTNEAHTNKDKWLPINVSHEPYEGFVYSLSVECEQLYIADGLVTHNCQAIYAFAGADAISFQRIIENTKAEVLPLNVCYRCPTSHLDLARKLVPAIEARPGAPVGKIEHIDSGKVPTLAKPGALVMCRLTAPLVSLYFKLIQNKVRAKVMGKDIGKQLIDIMDKVAKYEGFRYDQAIAFLEKYREHQVMMLMQRDGMEQQIENVNDQVETLIVCITNFDSAKTLQMLKDVLEDLFGDQDKENWKTMVTLCTVHRAKGLEANTTFILKPDKMPLVWKGQSHSDFEQELNILYVALTRSMDTMYICGELPTPVMSSLAETVKSELAQDKAEVIQPALPLQPALLELPSPKPEPVSAKIAKPELTPIDPIPAVNLQPIDVIAEKMKAGFTPQIKAFMSAAAPAPKPIEITPVVVSSTHTFPAAKQRAGYTQRVTDALDGMSTGEILQLMSVLEAVLEDRKEQKEAV